MSPTSIELGVAVANVEAFLTPGTTVTLTGAGFDTVNGLGINLLCGCPGGSLGPFFVYAGATGFSTNGVSFALPTEATGGPTTGPGSFQAVIMGNFSAAAPVWRAKLRQSGHAERINCHG